MKTNVMRILIYSGDQELINDTMCQRGVKNFQQCSGYSITEVFMDELSLDGEDVPKPKEPSLVERGIINYKNHKINLVKAENKVVSQATCNHPISKADPGEPLRCTDCGEVTVKNPTPTPESQSLGLYYSKCTHSNLMARREGKSGFWCPDCGHTED